MTTFRPIAIAPFVLVLFAVSAYGDDWRSIPLVENGQVAPGWQHVGWGKMEVDGEVLRTEPSEKGLGLLVHTKEKLGDCQIRIVYRPAEPRDNAGVHVRMDDGIVKWLGRDSIAVKRNARGRLDPDQLERMKEASEKEEGAWYAVHHGFEVQICDSADRLHRTGSIYSYAAAADLPAKAAGEWRSMVITLDGERVSVELDGVAISQFDAAASDLPPRKDWTEPKREYRRPAAGYIGLQTHDPGDIVYFREVSVRRLSARR